MDIPTLHQPFSPAKTAIEPLYQAHTSSLKKLVAQASSQPRPMKTFEEIEASQHRLQALKNDYRQSVELLNAKDIDRVANGQYQEQAAALKAALEQLKATDP